MCFHDKLSGDRDKVLGGGEPCEGAIQPRVGHLEVPQSTHTELHGSAPLSCQIHKGHEVITIVDCKAVAEVPVCSDFATWSPSLDTCVVTVLGAVI